MPAHPADKRWMSLALSLGRRTMGQTWPNPAVGCVIVKDGRVVGRGWTQSGCRPHGEAMALKQAGVLALGATAYVTLEPCAHHGKTPPCAEALIKSGISRVVSAVEDPDKRVSGKGHAMLTAAGVAVDVGCLGDKAAADHQGFFLRTADGRPFVTLKLAGSFDGRTATAEGESKWITGPEARRLVHLMRARHDAVMVGAGTVADDNPSLTVRDLGISGQPVRVFCDSQLRADPGCNLGRTAREVPVWPCYGPEAESAAIRAWQAAGALPVGCMTGADGRLDMNSVMQELAAQGLTRVFCEGGKTLAASLLSAGLVDQLVGFAAGLVLGENGLPLAGDMPGLALADVERFQLSECRQIGADVMHVWHRV